MGRTRWLIFNKKTVLLVLGILVLLVLIYKSSQTLELKTSTFSEDEFHNALQNTVNSESFYFRLSVKMGKRLISDIEGKRVAPDKIHITGNIQNTPVEFIHTGDKSYIKGYWSENWSVLEKNKLVDSELFFTEINPLGIFVFKEIPQIKILDPENFDGEKLQVVEIKPIVENPLMELNYDDFVYRVWIEPNKKLIKKTLVTASGKNGTRDKLEIMLELWDYNKQIKITPPEKL